MITAYPPVLSLLTTSVIEPVLGLSYYSTAQWLREFTAMHPLERRAWQLERFGEVARYAQQHVRYYADLDVSQPPERLLASLPVVDKATIRSDETLFRADDAASNPSIAKKTGGTSGDPWRYPLDKRAWSHMYGAYLHMLERAGYRYGERMVALGAPTSLGLESPSWKTRLRSRLERRNTSLTGFELDPRSSLDRARRAASTRAAVWYGYAGTITAMAEAVLDAGEPVRSPRIIVTTAEPLDDSAQQRIEAAFGRRVIDQYGCNDGGIFATKCAAGSFHVAENVSIVEVLDGDRPCAPGVEGDVTVTNLHARVLPFLRYKIGDRAALGDGSCACGEPGVTLQRLSGRTGDRVQLPDGTELSALSFQPVFMELPRVRQWQLVQREHQLIVRVRALPSMEPEDAELIETYVRRHTRGTMGVSVVTDEPFHRSAGGKHLIVVREPDGSGGG